MISPAAILLIVYLCYKRNNLLVAIYIAFFMSVYVKAGYFLSLGSIEILYGQFFAFYSIFLYVIYGAKRIKKKQLVKVFIFLLLAFSSYISVAFYRSSEILVYANGSDYAQNILTLPSVTSENVKDVVNLLIFSFFLVAINDVEKKKLCEFIVFTGKFVLLLVLMEFFLKNIFGSNILSLSVDSFFGKGIYQIDYLFQRGNYFALQGLTREPNQLARGLLIWALLVIFMNKKEVFFLPLTLFLLFVSGSFAGSMFFIFLLSLIVIRNLTAKMIPILVLLGVSLAYVFSKIDFTYYLDRLSFFQEDLRVISIIRAYEVFLSYPLLGVGLGNSMAYSGTLTLLSNLGILGCLAWVVMCTASLKYTKSGYMYLAVLSFVFIFVGGKEIAYTAYTAMLFLMLDKSVLKREYVKNQ